MQNMANRPIRHVPRSAPGSRFNSLLQIQFKMLLVSHKSLSHSEYSYFSQQGIAYHFDILTLFPSKCLLAFFSPQGPYTMLHGKVCLGVCGLSSRKWALVLVPELHWYWVASWFFCLYGSHVSLGFPQPMGGFSFHVLRYFHFFSPPGQLQLSFSFSWIHSIKILSSSLFASPSNKETSLPLWQVWYGSSSGKKRNILPMTAMLPLLARLLPASPLIPLAKLLCKISLGFHSRWSWANRSCLCEQKLDWTRKISSKTDFIAKAGVNPCIRMAP